MNFLKFCIALVLVIGLGLYESAHESWKKLRLGADYEGPGEG
jgi:hypothetical protein